MRWSIRRSGRDGVRAQMPPVPEDPRAQRHQETADGSARADASLAVPPSTQPPSPCPPSTPRHLALPAVSSEVTPRAGADLVPADLLPPGTGVPRRTGPGGTDPGGTEEGGTGEGGTEPGIDPVAGDPGQDVPGPDPSLLLAAVCDPRIPAELRDLRQRMPGIEATLVASVDGVVLAHDPPGREVHEAGRVALALLTQGRQATVALGRGRFRNSVIWGTDGYLAVYAVGQGALLLVQTSDEARVGRLHVEARSTSAAIAALLA
jgi:predicted regulator of Ras-like GTPase activity (Roadblock/LC7/MglB family)